MKTGVEDHSLNIGIYPCFCLFFFVFFIISDNLIDWKEKTFKNKIFVEDEIHSFTLSKQVSDSFEKYGVEDHSLNINNTGF